MCEGVDVDPASLPCKRKAPKRFEVGSNESFSGPCTPKDHYWRHYFESIDLVTNAIKNRFEQPGYQVYKNLKELLLTAACGHDCNKEFKAVVDYMVMIWILVSLKSSYSI